MFSRIGIRLLVEHHLVGAGREEDAGRCPSHAKRVSPVPLFFLSRLILLLLNLPQSLSRLRKGYIGSIGLNQRLSDVGPAQAAPLPTRAPCSTRLVAPVSTSLLLARTTGRQKSHQDHDRHVRPL